MATLVQKTFTTTCNGELLEAINSDGNIAPTLLQILNDAAAPTTTDFWFASALNGAEDTYLDGLLSGWSCPAENQYPVEDQEFNDSAASDPNVIWSSDKITSDFAPISHTHLEADITDLQAYLLDITGESIKSLSDVFTSMSPIDGQVLTYDTTNGWQAETPASGVTDHTLLSNIGTNTHAQIDTHIADATVHFTQASISITESQISDLGSYALVGHTHTKSDITDFVEGDYLHTTGNESATGNKTLTGNTKLGHTFTSNYTLSVQKNADNAYIEILNSAGANKGAFFGVENYLTPNDFCLYNYQGGPITFYTDTVASSENRRMVIQPDGDVEIKNLTAGVVKSAADGTLSSGTITEADISDLGDYVLVGGDTMTGALTVNAAVTTGDLTVKHDSVSDSDVIFDANGRNGAPGFSISKPGSSGYMHLFPNSEAVQWIAGNPSAANGDNDFYLDADNQGIFRINTLPGAGKFGEVICTNNAPLRPAEDANSNLGTATHRWNELRAVTLYGDGSNLTGVTATETNDLTAAVTWANVPDANITQTSVTQHQAALTITESQISDLGNYSVVGHTHAAADITSGTFADARISQTSVTQHEAALTITESQISDLGSYGDVSAGATITDNAVVRGDGGAKGIQGSSWLIEDDGLLHNTSISRTGYALEVWNTQATPGGGGLHVRGGETGGDIAMRIADADDTFTLMEIEADQGHVTFGKTFAQTQTDNGVVHGIDVQHGSGVEADINTQNGQFKMAGTPITLASSCFYADQVEYPTGSDWNVNVGAPASADSNNSSLTVRRFDDSTDEAIGFMICVPPATIEMSVVTMARAETAPGSTQTAVMVLHKRQIPNNAAIPSWSTNALTNIDLPTNENFQMDMTVDTLSNWGMTAGTAYQMQLSRDANNGSDNLSGDLSLLMVMVEFR